MEREMTTSIKEKVINFLSDELEQLTEQREVINRQIDEIETIVDALADLEGTRKISEILKVAEMSHMEQIQDENRKAILSVLSQGDASVKQIAEIAGMNRGTIQGHLTQMRVEGRVTRKKGESNGGQPPYVYSIVPQVEYREHRVDLKTRLVD